VLFLFFNLSNIIIVGSLPIYIYEHNYLINIKENYMKVNINNFFNMQTSSKSKEKTTQPLPQNVSTGRSRNCDEIIISGRVQKADQNRFIDELKNQISKEVNTPSSEQKIASLKQQIEEGNYQIDIDQIAKKMLLH